MSFEMKQDGGWAWCVCVGSFLINFVASMYMNCGGVVLSALVDNYNIARSEAAWVSALPISSIYVFAPLSTFCCNRYGARLTVSLGAVISSTCLIISSFAPNIKLLYLSYGIGGGLGASLFYFPNFVMVSKYFKTKISTANGIATSGASVGTFVFSPVIQQLFSGLGMSNGFRVLASLHALLCIPVLLYRPMKTSQAKQADNRHQKWLDMGVCRSPSFLIWLGAIYLFQLNHMVPFIHLVRLGEDVGASKIMASLLISILAGCSFVGRTACGSIADIACCSRLRLCQMALLCIAVSTTLAAFAPSFTWLAVYAAVFGVSEGIYMTVFMVITRDIVGTEHLAFALGVMYCVLCIPKTVGPLLAGLMFDVAHNYVLPFMIVGGLTALSSILMFLIGSSPTVPVVLSRQSISGFHSENMLRGSVKIRSKTR